MSLPLTTVAEVGRDPEFKAAIERQALAVSEGFCPMRHRLQPTRLHGQMWGTCVPCGQSWRIKDGRLWTDRCAPGAHAPYCPANPEHPAWIRGLMSGRAPSKGAGK